MPRLVLYPGSLLDIETDVIVNAANSSLMGVAGWMARSIMPPGPR